MPIFESKLDVLGVPFAENQAHHRTLAEELRATLQQVAQGGSERARLKHTARGKLLPRERINLLLDPGSPFLEIAPMSAW